MYDRFANPLAADGWNGTRDASQEGNQCPQLLTWNEDCLYLNVFSPQVIIKIYIFIIVHTVNLRLTRSFLSE